MSLEDLLNDANITTKPRTSTLSTGGSLSDLLADAQMNVPQEDNALTTEFSAPVQNAVDSLPDTIIGPKQTTIGPVPEELKNRPSDTLLKRFARVILPHSAEEFLGIAPEQVRSRELTPAEGVRQSGTAATLYEMEKNPKDIVVTEYFKRGLSFGHDPSALEDFIRGYKSNVRLTDLPEPTTAGQAFAQAIGPLLPMLLVGGAASALLEEQLLEIPQYAKMSAAFSEKSLASPAFKYGVAKPLEVIKSFGKGSLFGLILKNKKSVAENMLETGGTFAAFTALANVLGAFFEPIISATGLKGTIKPKAGKYLPVEGEPLESELWFRHPTDEGKLLRVKQTGIDVVNKSDAVTQGKTAPILTKADIEVFNRKPSLYERLKNLVTKKKVEAGETITFEQPMAAEAPKPTPEGIEAIANEIKTGKPAEPIYPTAKSTIVPSTAVLEDLANQARATAVSLPKAEPISKEMDPLVQEAKKYNTVDEFIKGISKNEFRYEDSVGKEAVIGEIPISQFNGKDIVASQNTVDVEGVKKWKKRIEAGERPYVLVQYSERYKEPRIIDGHTRLTAYEQLGIKNIPVIDNTGKVLKGGEPLSDFYNKAKEVDTLQAKEDNEIYGGLQTIATYKGSVATRGRIGRPSLRSMEGDRKRNVEGRNADITRGREKLYDLEIERGQKGRGFSRATVAEIKKQTDDLLSGTKLVAVDKHTPFILEVLGFPKEITDNILTLKDKGAFNFLVFSEEMDGRPIFGSYSNDVLYLNHVESRSDIMKEALNHEINGHAWFEKLSTEKRIEFFQTMQANPDLVLEAWTKRKSPYKNYWGRTIDDIERRIDRIVLDETITDEILSNTGFVYDSEITLEDFIDQSLNIDQTLSIINKELADRGYDPLGIKAEDTQVINEHVAMIAESAHDLTTENPVLEDYIKGVKDNSLEFGKREIKEPTVYFRDVNGFEGYSDLSLKTLERLKGKVTVSRQFIQDLTNMGDLRQAERDAIRMALEEYPADARIPVKEFADKVKTNLLPLKINSPSEFNKGMRLGEKPPATWYENTALPSDIRGKVKDYKENIYQSPIKTSAGDVHFMRSNVPNYFAHTRIEEMADAKIRRVIEVQSDLYQKGNLEREKISPSQELIDMEKAHAEGKISTAEFRKAEDNFYGKRQQELSKLEPYRNTWQDRIIREEIKQAAKDGKTKLLFPTGETAMKIEGLGSSSDWRISVNLGERLTDNTQKLSIENIKVGQEISNLQNNMTIGDQWIITDVLGNGKFKAVPLKDFENSLEGVEGLTHKEQIDYARHHTPQAFDNTETFDISSKVDTSNPIYRFYEKEVGRYLMRNFDAHLITDKQGVSWFEVPIAKEMKEAPVMAFRLKDEEFDKAQQEYNTVQNIIDKYGKFPDTIDEANKLTPEELGDVFAYLPMDVQNALSGYEPTELESLQDEPLDAILDGRIKLTVPEDLRSEAMHRMGQGLYSFVFRRRGAGIGQPVDSFVEEYGFQDAEDLFDAIANRREKRMEMRDKLREQVKIEKQKLREKKITEAQMRKEIQKHAKELLRFVNKQSQRTTEGRQTARVIREAVHPKARMISKPEDVLLKERLKNQARGAKAGFKAGYAQARDALITKFNTKIGNIEEVRDQVVEYINDTIPLAQRGRFMTVVRDAKTARDLTKAFIRVDNYAEELKLKAAIADLKKTFDKAVDSAKIDVEYKKKIEAVMGQYELVGHRKETLEKLEETKKFIERKQSEGEDIYMPRQILERLDILSRIPKEQLTFSQIEGLQSQLDLLIQLGETRERTRQGLYDLKKASYKEKLKKSIITLEARPTVKLGLPQRMELKDKANETYSKTINFMALTQLVLRPMDGVADVTGMNMVKDVLDVGFTQYLDKSIPLMPDTGRILDHLITESEDIIHKYKLDDISLEKAGIYALSFRADAIEKLANMDIAMKDIEKLKSELTEGELAYADFARRSFDELFPLAKNLARDLYNQELNKLDDYVSFQTDFDAWDDLEMPERFGKNIDAAIQKKNVEKGMLEQRKGAGKQRIKLNLHEILMKHIDDLAYMATMAEPIKMFSEIIRDPEIIEKMGSISNFAWREYMDLMARKGGTEGAKTMKWIETLRRNMGIAQFAFKLSTTLVQTTSILDAAGSLGADWVGGAIIDVATSREWRDFVMDNMPEIRKSIGDDIAFREYSEGWFRNATKYGMVPMQKLDQLMRVTTAIAAYKKAAAEMGIAVDLKNPDAALIQLAQKAVRESQGSSFFKDQPLFLTTSVVSNSKTFNKSLGQFQSFMLAKWENIQRQIWRQGIKEKDFNHAFWAFFWIIVASAAMETGIRRTSKAITGGMNNNSFTHDMVFQMVSNIPVVGTAMSSWAFGSNPIPLINTIQQTGAGIKTAFTASSGTSRAKGIVRAASGASMLLGIPGSVQGLQIATNLIPEPKDTRIKKQARKLFQSDHADEANQLLDDAVKKQYITVDQKSTILRGKDLPDDIIAFSNKQTDAQLKALKHMSHNDFEKFVWYVNQKGKPLVKELSPFAAEYAAKIRNGEITKPVYVMGKIKD